MIPTLFEELSTAEIKKLEIIGVLQKFQEGDFIIREGEHGSSLFMVLSGNVFITKEIVENKFKKLDKSNVCDIFGEVCFMGVPSRIANVIAGKDCEVLEFEKDAIEPLLLTDIELGRKFYRGLARQLAIRLARNSRALHDAVQCSTTPNNVPRERRDYPVRLKLASDNMNSEC